IQVEFPSIDWDAYHVILIHNSILTILSCQKHPENNNMLNNFDVDYLLSSAARVLIFFQMFSIFPLIMYLIRSQLSCLFYNNPWPGIRPVMILNAAIVSIAVLAGIFFPNVGSIVRYFGAVCGMVLIYALPCLVYMKLSSRDFQLTVPKFFFHSCIIAFGVANLLAQFFF
ncbi:hypothetical protein KIN20_011810, partial [Parelaphostrongylus tenuis]